MVYSSQKVCYRTTHIKGRDQGNAGRFRCFTRRQIARHSDSPDITWLRDDSIRRGDGLAEPADIADEILAQLRIATQEMQKVARLLGETK